LIDCRNAKQPKVNTKENSFKVLDVIEVEDIDDEKEVVDRKEENKTSDNGDVKDSSKQIASTEIQDSNNMKSTPRKGIGRTRKSEINNQANSLTKFFKKIDNKDKDIKTESNSESKVEDSDESISINKSNEILEEVEDCQSTKKNKSDITNTLTKLNDRDGKSEKTDLASVINSNDSFQDDDEDDEDDEDNDDSGKSDTDSKRTEHEDTDSKDDNKIAEALNTTPTRNISLNCSVKIKRLTPKQIEKKNEIQKKRENREKQRLVCRLFYKNCQLIQYKNI
jgi:hypothetical protein